ncbi:hypothetical protein FGO68_gene15354 [Halteria grandinella]|uniref:Uncharacterized protein n=1 Tax=Halteria grandinella TaxID=5974 RepID=A0A8J8SYM8_HALGN|nr:hypothetical protein FGO68_gene15354 [Halteria grandinella]
MMSTKRQCPHLQLSANLGPPTRELSSQFIFHNSLLTSMWDNSLRGLNARAGRKCWNGSKRPLKKERLSRRLLTQ